MTKISAVFGILAVAGMASAQISAGSFTPEAVEDYEGTPGGRTPISSLFGGDVPVGGPDAHWSVDFGDWRDFRDFPASTPFIEPSSGSRFGTILGVPGTISLDFTGVGGILGFSGFASSAGPPGGSADVLTFFDMDGVLIDSVSSDPTGFGSAGIMESFSYVSTVAIGRVDLTGGETAYDDLAYTTIPAPASLVALAGLGAFAGRRRRA